MNQTNQNNQKLQENKFNPESIKQIDSKDFIRQPTIHKEWRKLRCKHCYNNMAYRNTNIESTKDTYWICGSCNKKI